MDMIQKALYFAAKKHGDQKYSDMPYMVHIACVMSVLQRYKAREDVIVAGILHDVLEDTDTTYEEIDNLFGDRVAKLVLAVTNPKEGSRKQKHEIQYPKIREAGVWAVQVKLADRIANAGSGGKLGMYQREHETFRKHLYDRGDIMIQAMWNELEEIVMVPGF